MRSGGMITSAASAPLMSGRSSSHPKIWQLHEVPCWDRILLEIFARPQPGCMGYVSACLPNVLCLNQSSSPDGEQTYDIVCRDPESEEYSLLDVLFVRLRSFDNLECARRRIQLLLARRITCGGPPVGMTIDSPAEHGARSPCPFCHSFLETPTDRWLGFEDGKKSHMK